MSRRPTNNPSLFRVGATLYLTLIFGLALATFLPDDANITTYLILFVLTLPSSVIAALVSYLVAVFTFGADNSSMFARLMVLTLWMSLAVCQVVVIRWIKRGGRRSERPA